MLNRLSIPDELVAAGVVTGALFGGVARVPTPGHRLGRLLFLMLCGFMAVEAVQGAVELISFRKVRWPLVFVLIWLCGFIAVRLRLTKTQTERLRLITAATGAAYFGWYVLDGLLAEYFRGISRWALQTAEWGSTAQVFLPALITVPCALLCLRTGSARTRAVSVASLIAVGVASIYYESRMGQLTLVVLVAASGWAVGWRRLTMVAAAGAVAVVVLVSPLLTETKLEDIVEEFTYMGQAVLQRQGESRDIDRIIYLEAGFQAISGNWSTLLFGYGFRVHSSVVGPFVHDLLWKYDVPRKDIAADPYNVEVESITAIVVDSGLVGTMLYVAVWSICAMRLLKCGTWAEKPIWLAAWGLSIVSLIAIYLPDAMLLYAMVMPGGLFETLAGRRGRGPVGTSAEADKHIGAGAS